MKNDDNGKVTYFGVVHSAVLCLLLSFLKCRHSSTVNLGKYSRHSENNFRTVIFKNQNIIESNVLNSFRYNTVLHANDIPHICGIHLLSFIIKQTDIKSLLIWKKRIKCSV